MDANTPSPDNPGNPSFGDVAKILVTVGTAVGAALLFGVQQNPPCVLENGLDIKEWIIFVAPVSLVVGAAHLWWLRHASDKSLLVWVALAYAIIAVAAAYGALRGCSCPADKPWFLGWFEPGFASWCCPWD